MFDQRAIDAFLTRLFAAPAAPTISASCRASSSWSRPISTPEPRSPSASRGTITCPSPRRSQASAALPGLFPPVAIDGEHYVDGALNKTLHASVALDEGVSLLFCINPLVPFDASSASRHRTAHGRKAAPGRLAAGAGANVSRDHSFADEGRHGKIPAAVSGRRYCTVRAGARRRRHVLRQHLQLCASQAAV